MSKSQLSCKLHIYSRKDNEPAHYWTEKIKNRIKSNYPKIVFDPVGPDILLILGGDGTILEGVKKYHHISNPLVLGLNLGHVGFLSSVRDPKNFLVSIEKFLNGKYESVERMMISVSVNREGKNIFSSEALNEVVVQNPLGLIDLEVQAGGTIIKKFRGSGAMVATATGSTAFNLSAHGPIVAPDIKCLIMTEIMTHDIPSPSIIFQYDQVIRLKIKDFRARGLVKIGGHKLDVILITDGGEPFYLEEGDIVIVNNSSHLARFAELENNYFFKSLKQKFKI